MSHSPADSGQWACLCSPQDRRASAWPGRCSTRAAELCPLLGQGPDVWLGTSPVSRLTDTDRTSNLLVCVAWLQLLLETPAIALLLCLLIIT